LIGDHELVVFGILEVYEPNQITTLVAVLLIIYPYALGDKTSSKDRLSGDSPSGAIFGA
jgi:hypothetical protein